MGSTVQITQVSFVPIPWLKLALSSLLLFCHHLNNPYWFCMVFQPRFEPSDLGTVQRVRKCMASLKWKWCWKRLLRLGLKKSRATFCNFSTFSGHHRSIIDQKESLEYYYELWLFGPYFYVLFLKSWGNKTSYSISHFSWDFYLGSFTNFIAFFTIAA